MGNGFEMFLFGRVLCAIGYSFGFTSSVMGIYFIFNEKKASFFIGMLVFIGYMGAACAGLPISSIITDKNWHNVFMIIGMLQVVIMIITVLILSRFSKFHIASKAKYFDYKGVVKIFKNKQVMVSIIIIGCLTASVFSIGDLWGKLYLVKVCDYDENVAAFAGNSIIFISTAVCGILLGFLEMKGFIN